MTHQASNALIVAQVLALVGPVVRRAQSDDDLRARLARIGYGYRDSRRGRMLTTMPHGVDIAPIPALNFAG